MKNLTELFASKIRTSAECYAKKSIPRQQTFDGLDLEHRALIGEKLASFLPQEELSRIVNSTRIAYLGGSAEKNAAYAITGFGVAALGLFFDYGIIDNVMMGSGALYGIIKALEVCHDMFLAYGIAKLSSNQRHKV